MSEPIVKMVGMGDDKLLVAGRLRFHNAEDAEKFASVIVLDRKVVGLMFGVYSEIGAILKRDPATHTPLDRNLLDEHLQLVVRERMIWPLCDFINSFFEDLEVDVFGDEWKQSFGYIRWAKDDQYYRIYMLNPPDTPLNIEVARKIFHTTVYLGGWIEYEVDQDYFEAGRERDKVPVRRHA